MDTEFKQKACAGRREYEIVHEEHEPGPSGRDERHPEREGHRHRGVAEHSRAHDRDRNRDRAIDRSRHENGHSDRRRSDDRDRRRDREDFDRDRCGVSCRSDDCRKGSMHSPQSKPGEAIRLDKGIDGRGQVYSVLHVLSSIPIFSQGYGTRKGSMVFRGNVDYGRGRNQHGEERRQQADHGGRDGAIAEEDRRREHKDSKREKKEKKEKKEHKRHKSDR